MRALIPFTALLILLVQTAAGSPVRRQVDRIRCWTAPDHTRVVLDMSSQSTYRIRTMTAPHRVVIDIPSGRFAPDVKKFEVDDGVLTRVRVNKLNSGVQVVLDLPRKTDFKHFALDPNNVHPHRIVIDLKKVLTSSERKEKKERAARVANSGDFVVIIDPGHGGSKPGTCSRKGLMEKDFALKLSRMIASEIEAHKGFTAVLTRNGDYDVDLYGRVQKARSHGGQCFISVHFNGNKSSRPRGSEVYFLSLKGAADENAQAVAERENMLLEMGHEGDAMEDDVQSILFDFARNDAMRQSSLLAESIGEEMERVNGIPFRGVKQSNFVILRGIAMPSVLVEAAYLTNRKDVDLIRKESVLRNMARSISDGVIDFLLENPPPGSNRQPRQVAVHVVSKGETLWGIARKYGLTVAQVRDLNGMGERSRIRPGQKLRVYK